MKWTEGEELMAVNAERLKRGLPALTKDEARRVVESPARANSGFFSTFDFLVGYQGAGALRETQTSAPCAPEPPSDSAPTPASSSDPVPSCSPSYSSSSSGSDSGGAGSSGGD